MVTTATQPAPKVTAAGFAPAGRIRSSGSIGAPALKAWGIRVTISPTTVMTPPIIVRVRTITSHFKSRRLGGRTGSGASGVTGSDMDGPFEDDDTAGLLDVVIGPDAPARLDKALAAAVPEAAALSRSRLMRMIADGEVTRNGVAVTDSRARVAEGEVYTLHLAPAVEVETRAEAIPLAVVWEDADLIVIDKAAGMVVHPAPGSPTGTLVNALLHHSGNTLSGIGGARRPGIVHRIDKDTSGLLVAAKSDRAHHGLARQFEDHSVTRHYLAVAHGVPSAADPRLRGLRGISFESGGILKIATHLARHKTDRQRQAVVWDQGRHAVTRARVDEAFAGQAALVDCWLETGRTHQIRVHLAYAGHGLIGDPTYGGKKRLSDKALGPGAEVGNSFPRQALHAASLGFDHPVTGERMEFSSPLPADICSLIEAMRAG